MISLELHMEHTALGEETLTNDHGMTRTNMEHSWK